jgi:hypothetical protein
MLRKPRPSAAIVVAVLALVAAVVGTAAALPGSNTVFSDDIAPGNVKLSDLHANSVNSAKVAPKSLRDVDIRDYEVFGNSSVKVAATDGASEAAARAAAPKRTLASKGPLTIYAKCFRNVAVDRTFGEIDAETTVNGTLLSSSGATFDGDVGTFLNTFTVEGVRQIAEDSEDTDHAGASRSTYDLAAPDGTNLSGIATVFVKDGNVSVNNGAYGAGNICIFGGFAAG